MSDKPIVRVSLANATPVKKPKPDKPKLKRLWDNYQVVGEVRKSDRIKFVIGAGIRDGVRYINIREFYLKKSDETWMPGRDGITIPLKVPVETGTKMLEPWADLAGLLLEAADTLAGMELYDEDNAVYIEKKERN